MKDKILIGEKMTKKGVFLNYLGLVFFGIIAVVGYNGLISKYLHLNNQLNILIMIFIFIAVLLFLTPIIGSSEIIEFNHNEVRYFHTKGYFQQFAEVIRILTGKQAVPDITLKTKDIEQVNLSYVPFLMMYAQQGYQIKITFLMKDGTTLAFLPSTIDQMEKGDYESAFKILETNGVEIVDKLMLRKALKMNKNDFYQYVNTIEKGRNKNESYFRMFSSIYQHNKAKT